MLAFFYKHQKKFIGLVIVGVCVSGIGIGWGRYPGESSRGSKKVVFSVPGKKYSEKEFLAFKRFFTNEAYPFTGNPQEWNFLNEGLLTERFLTNKLGEKLFLKVYSQNYPAFKKKKLSGVSTIRYSFYFFRRGVEILSTTFISSFNCFAGNP